MLQIILQLHYAKLHRNYELQYRTWQLHYNYIILRNVTFLQHTVCEVTCAYTTTGEDFNLVVTKIRICQTTKFKSSYSTNYMTGFEKPQLHT